MSIKTVWYSYAVGSALDQESESYVFKVDPY